MTCMSRWIYCLSVRARASYIVTLSVCVCLNSLHSFYSLYKQYHSMSFNSTQCHKLPCNTMQYHAMPFNSTQCHAIPSILKIPHTEEMYFLQRDVLGPGVHGATWCLSAFCILHVITQSWSWLSFASLINVRRRKKSLTKGKIEGGCTLRRNPWEMKT